MSQYSRKRPDRLSTQHMTVEGGEKSDFPPPALPGLSQGEADNPERLLMQRIYAQWQGHIAEAKLGSTLPDAFLAALTANESGGDSSASYFEPTTYAKLAALASGQTTAFGSIERSNLFAALQDDGFLPAEGTPRRVLFVQSAVEFLQRISSMEEAELRELATSWGLTQIMGYQIVGRKAAICNLIDPQFHYRFAVELLTEFAGRFCLKLARDFEALFRCWNTGQPEGETFDPDYVARGMRRMQLYEELLEVARAKAPAHPPEGDARKSPSA